MSQEPPKPHRRGAVGIVVHQGRLLVIRRSRHVAAPRTFCFPGGGIEDHESEEEALVREFQEEVYCTVAPLRRLWENVTPWGVHLAWWLAHLLPGPEPRANPAEVESVHWFTPEEMAALPELLSSNRLFLDKVAAGEIDLS